MTHYCLKSGVAAAALLASSAAFAQTAYTIPSGTSETAPRILNSAGDSLTIEADAKLQTSGVDAAQMNAADQSVDNGGTIATTGSNADGIHSFGDDATITNSGTITTSGVFSDGIWSQGDAAMITNSGRIETTGNFSYGIGSQGHAAAITNSGTITTDGDNPYGIYSAGDFATITNSGTIAMTGSGAYGIYSTGDFATITNSGVIMMSGTFSDGILSLGNDATISNSGTILSAASYSIRSTGANATLNLVQGSVLQGDLSFVQPASATLNIGPGLSTALRFDTSGSGDIPATINTFGAPFAAVGDWVYSADVTALRMQGTALVDLTGGIVSAIGGRRTAGTAVAPLAYAAESKVANELAIFRRHEVPVREVWLKGFGAFRDQNGSASMADSDQALAGFVSGVDVFTSPDWVAGVFIGGAWAETEVAQSQNVETTSAFGGAYATRDFGAAKLDMALTLGWSEYDSERQVANNAVPGGLETAEADYTGWFVSPHIALTQSFLAGTRIIEARVSARYAGLFLDDYAETGSAANLSVAERDLHLFVGRGEVAVPLERMHDDGALTRFTPSLGVEGRVQFGDDSAAGTLAGTGIVFSTDEDAAIGGFAGLLVEHEAASGVTMFAEAEGLIEDDGSTRLFGKGGLRARF